MTGSDTRASVTSISVCWIWGVTPFRVCASPRMTGRRSAAPGCQSGEPQIPAGAQMLNQNRKLSRLVNDELQSFYSPLEFHCVVWILSTSTQVVGCIVGCCTHKYTHEAYKDLRFFMINSVASERGSLHQLFFPFKFICLLTF